MKTIRHRTTNHLDNRAPEQSWAGAPCTDLNRAFLWDLELDNNGTFGLAETRAERDARHREAKTLCRECPALALCAGQPINGRAGVIAGRVVTA